MLFGDLAADVGDPVVDIRGFVALPLDGDPDCPEQHVGQLERVGLRDVEPVEKPVSDQVEIRGHGRTGVAVERAQGFEHGAGVVIRREQLPSLRIRFERGDQLLELARRSCGCRRRAAHQAEQLGRRDIRPVPAHVLGDHRRVVVAGTRQMRDQVLVGELIGIDRLELAMRLDRGRLDRLVPVAKLLAPELPLDDLFRTLEAPRNLGLRNRPHRLVREALDVRHLEGVEQHPVEAGEIADAALEGLRVGLDPVLRHRTRKMNGFELPRPGARRLEAKLCRCLCLGQWKSFRSRLSAPGGRPAQARSSDGFVLLPPV